MIIGLIGGIGSGKSAASDILKNEYGFEILKTDDIAKKLRQPGMAVYKRLVREFGEGILEDGDIDNKKLAALIYSDSAALKKANDIIHPAVWEYVDNEIYKRMEAWKAGCFMGGQCVTEEPHTDDKYFLNSERHSSGKIDIIHNHSTVSGSGSTGRSGSISDSGSATGANVTNMPWIAVETALPSERFRSMCDRVWYVYADRETRIRRLMESRGYGRTRCEKIMSEQKSEEEYKDMADAVIDNSGSLDAMHKMIAEMMHAEAYALRSYSVG